MATIAPSLTASAFLRQIRESKLTDLHLLDSVLAKLPATIKEAEDPKPLARALIENRLLTKFQATLMLQGKARSLMVAGKYRLIDRLGAGGMGLVYLCEHVNLKRLVALKVMPQKSANDPAQRERFLREAQTAAALRHPNIVQAHDVDSDHGVFYFVMDYVDGIDLERLVAKKGPLDPIQACHYISQSAEGLQHAAENGLVHRDIKPANLLVERGGGIKLLDLGLARFCDNTEGLTAQLDGNAVIGTADYIAPEQAINSSDVDTRADIYALGCTFYFLLAGRAPFKEANVTQKLLMHQMRDPIAITELRPDVPGAMGSVLAKMIAKDPAHRYQTPQEVVNALAPWTQTPMRPLSESDLPSRFGGTQPSVHPSEIRSSSTSTVSMSRGTTRNGSSVTSNTAQHRGQTIQIVRPREDKNKVAKYVAVGGFGAVIISMAFWRPWITPGPSGPVIESPIVPVTPKAATTPSASTAASNTLVKAPVKLSSGVPYFAMESGAARPAVTSNGIRATPTDVIFLSGEAIGSHGEGEKEFLTAIRNDFFGGKTGPILPYAFATLSAKYPNTLISLDVNGGLRPLELNDRDYLPVDRLSSATKDDNVLIRANAVLPSGVREFNSLVSSFSDISASPGGTILRLKSGTFLLSGSRGSREASFGSGSNALIVDFGGRIGYLTVASGDSFYVNNDPYEYTLRAKLTGFDNEPLVISGMGNTILQLENNENDFNRLIVQGAITPTTLLEQQFRVNFSDNRHLGSPGGLVGLTDAILSYVGTSPATIDRTLHVGGKQGRIAVGPQTPLTWSGRVTGTGRLAKSGNGILFLSNPNNDHKGGTDVSYGELALAAEEGTPAGTGQVAIATNSTLSGTGRIPGQVTVYPNGTLQPGSDDGKPMRVNELALMRGRPPGVKDGDFPSIFHAHLTPASNKLLIHTGKKTVELSNSLLRLDAINGFKPMTDTKIFLITQEENASPLKGNFVGLSQNATVKTVDGAWSAKISYEGNAATGATSGGNDVVLYDWTAGSK